MVRVLVAVALLVPGLVLAGPCATPSFSLPFDLGLPAGHFLWLDAAEVDGDGRPDVVAFSETEREIIVFWNRAEGLDPGPVTELDETIYLSVSVVDLNDDGRADLLVDVGAPWAKSRSLEPRLGDGAGGFVRAAAEAVVLPPYAVIALARVDGGGIPDLLAVSPSASDATKLQVGRWRARGDGTFLAPTTVLTLDNPFPAMQSQLGLVAGDVDGDGRTDLVVSSHASSPGISYSSSVWLGDGAGGFGRSPGAPAGFATELRDVDGDGRDELVASEQGGEGREVGILKRETGGTWVSLGRWTTSGDVLLGELDGDPTRLEALLTEGPFRLFRLEESGPVELATLPARSPATLLDLDGDGRLDVLTLAPDPLGPPARLVLARGGCGPGRGTTSLFVPAFLCLTGAEATRFETELTVSNLGAAGISAVLRFHPADGGAEHALSTFSLEPGRVRRFSTAADAGAEKLVLPDGVSLGTAILEASTLDGSSPGVVADVRVVSERPGSGRGGVGFRARPAEGQQVGSRAELAWLVEDSEDRTNLAVASVGPDPVTLRVTVFSGVPGRPEHVVLPDRTLAPYGIHQWNRILATSGLGGRSGWARIERVAGGPWTAWATVNSNGTGDGSVVEAQGASSGDFLPAIVGSDRYRTDLVLTNPTYQNRRAILRFPAVSGGESISLDVEVGPESSRTIDPVAALRDALVIPPVSYVGHCSVPQPFLAGARVRTTSSSSSFGVYTPPARLTSGQTMLVTGLRQDEGNRSNLAIVVPDLEPSSLFRVELFDGRTGERLKAIEDVAPGGTWGAPSRVQLDSVLLGTGAPFGWARVTRTAGGGPFFAYAVVNDGAAPGLGSGDGTYLPGIPR
ncbi:MAG: VCBS repeat-containing protein [Holophagales bacterium]|nr:VCBS repeat-containing protein [Holophagales bacterium]